jgi:hypothetical protein
LGWTKIKKIIGSSRIKNGRSIQDGRQILFKPANRLFYQLIFSQKFKMAPIFNMAFFLASFSRSSGIRQNIKNAKIFEILKFLANARASRKDAKKRHIKYGCHLEFLRKKNLHKSKVFRQPIIQQKKFDKKDGL